MKLVRARPRKFVVEYQTDADWFVRAKKLIVPPGHDPRVILANQNLVRTKANWDVTDKQSIPVTTLQTVQADFDEMNKALAQACLKVKLVGKVTEIDAPKIGRESVDVLGPNLNSRKHFSVHVDTGNDPVGEEMAIYKLHDTQDAASAAPIIYYVNRLHYVGRGGFNLGLGKTLIAGAGKKWKNRILVSSKMKKKYTVPHELLHVLLNSGHFRREINSDLFKGGTSDEGPLHQLTKRIPMDTRRSEPAEGQVRKIRNSPVVK